MFLILNMSKIQGFPSFKVAVGTLSEPILMAYLKCLETIFRIQSKVNFPSLILKSLR